MEIGAEKGEEKGQKGKKEGIREKQVYQLSHILCDCHAFFSSEAVTSPKFQIFHSISKTVCNNTKTCNIQ